MLCYETIYILHPDLGDEAVDAAKTRVDEIMAATGARIYRRENWGRKRLAYTVAKQQKGNYQLIQYIGSGQTVADLERMFRLDDAFIKYLTVRLKQDPATAEAQAKEAEAKAEARADERTERGRSDDRPDRGRGRGRGRPEAGGPAESGSPAEAPATVGD
jgi:small subunit ribosomal protein S6